MTAAEKIQIYVSVISAIMAGIAAIIALYVTVRLYKFKDELVKTLNGIYVKSEVFKPWRDRVEHDIEKTADEIYKVHDKINLTNLEIAKMKR